MSQGLMNMWISFIALILMFVAAFATLISREKLSGWLQKIVLFFAFICIVVSGIIVLLIVVGGPTSEM